ncbi:MAG TPA: DUF1080 domain-containing protein [Bryobacteraceae bacterium]|nr:DUF1080 domain-containing protein [Bryobacteraceae bacterium]
MKLAALILTLATLAFPQKPNSLTPREAADGWLLLFDGQTTFGWTQDGEGRWRVQDGVLVGEGGNGWLRTNAQFADYLLKCEFRTGGSALPFGVGTQTKVSGGRWHAYEVSASNAGFVVTLNGKRIAGGKEAPGVVGAIGLAVTDGNKVEFRSIRLKPLGLTPIFDGKSLTGWRKVERPNTKEPPVWSVQNGAIHVEKGPGQLETERQWTDFVLQLDIRTNPRDAQHHPNSGVFFRGVPGVFWSGYEAQIRNEYAENDREKPVDFGTGAIYRNQAARKIVANDGEFFTMTVVARGRRLCTFVNGWPVVDWEDPNPEGQDVRKKQAKLTGGVFSLQAHDPTTNLDFKNIRVAALPGAETAK